MAVPEQMPIVVYTANGTTKNFPITFDLHDDRYLDVLVNKELAKVGAYTIDTGKSVVFIVAPKSGDEIILARSTTLDRPTDFNTYDNSFRPSALNWDFDKIWHKLQEQYLIDANFLARLKNEIETRRTSDSLLQHQIDILNSVLIGVFEKASSSYLLEKLKDLEDSMQDAIDQVEIKADDFFRNLSNNYLALAIKGDWLTNSPYKVKDLVFYNSITYICLITHVSTTFSDDLTAKKWAIYQGATQVDLQNYTPLSKDYLPILNERSVKFKLNPIMASFLYGMNDPLPLDDSKNHFRGLTNKDAWAEENIGVGGFSVGRNGCPFAYLSSTWGHDCITFGVASFAGGAGCGTGDPDNPTDGAIYGYCSFCYGKDSLAKGRISFAIGQECISGSIHSFAGGMESETGKGLTTHPDGVASDGNCAFTFGYRAKAFGDFATALGSFIEAYNGGMIFGRGINPGSKLIANDAMVFGYGVDVPTITLKKGNGTNDGYGKLGVNTSQPVERVDINIKSGEKIAICSEKGGGGSLDLQSLVYDAVNEKDVPASIFRFDYTSPNIGSAYGVTTLYQNGNKFMTINESGDPTFNRIVNADYGYYVGGLKVIGGQNNAISDAEGSDVASVNIKLNEIIAVLRSHGLIAT